MAIEKIEEDREQILYEIANGAEKENAGYKAVSVMPEIEGGAPQADVVLLKGTDAKSVEQKL